MEEEEDEAFRFDSLHSAYFKVRVISQEFLMILSSRSKVASEVDDDMFDNWDKDGFGDYDGYFGEDEGPKVMFSKYHRYTFV